MELEESTFLNLDYTTKIQSLGQYGTGTKTEMQANVAIQKARNKHMDIHVPQEASTKEARIYNGTKTASSVNGARKTGQLHVKG